ncbi:MAG: bifunctional oligoribonuclease/PAP phosphatase NrnA [Anaerolineae bacterium]|nr:bifunctional oligoribonuclease/PAP phosphatase NrnA [Anaerolineae bacterium]MDW8070185.1 bifunctional oligoribonuclease/PAP phosphatase NrnA [Anaerolineae bacterium]
MWDEVLAILQRHHRFLITTHSNPDLDALGCELALDEHLRATGKQVCILNSDPIARPHRFVDPQRRIRVYQPHRHDQVIEQAEVLIVLDASGGWKRLGRIGDTLARMRPYAVRIDHHPDPQRFADVEVVDDSAAATAELVFDLVRAASGQITKTMARALYVAILTDTGSFRYPKTSPRTHRITAELIELGADPAELAKLAYNQYSLNLLRLQGHMLDIMQSDAEGRLVWSVLDQDTLRTYGVREAELDNFASFGLQVAGTLVSVLCVETPDGRVKVSLRSDASLPVNDLAAEWGGGGHASAAGATVSGDLRQVTEMVISRVKALLDSNGPRVPDPASPTP